MAREYSTGDGLQIIELFNGSHTQWSSPERKLLAAVLWDVIDVLQMDPAIRRRNIRKQRVYGEAVRWVMSDDRGWIFSFENICDSLNLDAGAARMAIRRRFGLQVGFRLKRVA